MLKALDSRDDRPDHIVTALCQVHGHCAAGTVISLIGLGSRGSFFALRSEQAGVFFPPPRTV